jgi:PhnB protein
MTPITPYLFFDGNCREAMTFYRDCLGGELHLSEIGDSPGAEHMHPEARQKIMHAALTNGAGGSLLMASDWMSNSSAMAPGNNISLSLHCTSDDHIRSLFAKLSDGGNVTNPLADQFWGATFGMLTDKFGIKWMLNFDKNTKK